MANFAKLDENNNVLEVYVVHNDELLDANGVEHEAFGVAFLISWSGGYPHWKQTSYSGSIRKNYAGTGYTYDQTRDAFIPPKPYQSWVLEEQTCVWTAPVPLPEGDKAYQWDEGSVSWVEITT